MNKWMGDGLCVFGTCVYVRRGRVLEFIIPFDLGLRRRVAPSETSELIKRAESLFARKTKQRRRSGRNPGRRTHHS